MTRDARPRPDCWTLAELRAELRAFEHELVAARLRPKSVHTHVDRSERFLRWLGGDYSPAGPR